MSEVTAPLEMTGGVLHGKNSSWPLGDVLSLGGVGCLCLQLMLCPPLFLQKLMENLAFSIFVLSPRTCWLLPYSSQSEQTKVLYHRLPALPGDRELLLSQVAVRVCVCVCVCVCP